MMSFGKWLVDFLIFFYFMNKIIETRLMLSKM